MTEKMNISALGWLGLVLTLCISSFGASWVVALVVGLLSLIVGLLTVLYVQNSNTEEDYFHSSLLENPLTVRESPVGVLEKLAQSLKKSKNAQKQDRRVTGSDVIDSSLQEIFGYIIRDYIQPWYGLISNDSEFLESGVRKSAQTLAINISNRVKEIDWLPYLTTRLVDDAATHLRLFRQARAKIKTTVKPKSPRGSPMRSDLKLSPKRTHKRNKSETDVGWYFGSRSAEKRVTDNAANLNTLEEYFFDLECKMENNLICRDVVSMDIKKETEFLSELTELLLYTLLPDEDFQCKPVCFILRELFATCIIRPLLNMIADPDYINQVVIWLCFRDATLPSDIFLTTLRITDNCEELKYTKEIVSKEIQQLRSRDSGGESDAAIKQQLSSLNYLIKIIDNRMSKLEDTDNPGLWNQQDYPKLMGDWKPLNLPLDAILKNNVALSYFIDYVTSIGQQSYLFFYLNVEGWKVTAEQQISNIEINKIKGITENTDVVYDKIRETAYNIYEQYLGEKSQHKLQVHPSLVQTLFFRIKNLTDQPSELWFDEIQKYIYEKLKSQDQFLPGFERSGSYLRLLAELDLLGQSNLEEDELSLSSLEEDACLDAQSDKTCSDVATPTNSDLSEKDYLTLNYTDNTQKISKHARSYSDITDIAAMSKNKPENKTHKSESHEQFDVVNNEDLKISDTEEDYSKLKVGNFTLSVDIIEAGVMSEKGKTFGIYATQVTKMFDTGFLEQWHIYRRYSDFHDLYSKIKEKFVDLSKLPFPGKKTFHNMDRVVLERRMRMLNTYMQEVCRRVVVDSHVGLRPLLLAFTEQGEYDRATGGGHISQTIDTLKSGMKTIKNMPEQLINTVDEVVGGLTKVFHSKNERVPLEASKVGASIEETHDNIPLRIMLLLMDEVFDLKSRNQWLRRRIVTLLRQIVRTMFGDIVNRRILDYVSVITSPKNVAHYLHTFKNSLWPNGIKAEKKPVRSEAIRSRTRVAAKVALLSTLSDELKHIIGSETTRRGLLTVFELFQRPILNRRLLYVLIEGVLCTLFPEKNMTEIFQKLHSNSRRVPGQKQNYRVQKTS
ncbi:snazarus [Carabus blaptoides fortunei]